MRIEQRGNLVLKRLRFPPGKPKNYYDQKFKGDVSALPSSDIEGLLSVLEHIPLAIQQAAAFMNRNRMSL